MKIYIASGFFTPEQIRIRDLMVSHVHSLDPSNEVFRPDLTEASQSYSGSPGMELGKKIYDENIFHIENCEVLVFPKGTDDLGTLFEVGVALQLGKTIWRFDPDEMMVRRVVWDKPMYNLTSQSLIQVEDLSSAVFLGYHYKSEFKKYYVLGRGMSDNLMLRMMATRVDYNPHTKKFEVKNFDISEAA